MKSALAAVILLAPWGIYAQTAPAPLSFEVASIRPSGPDLGMMLQMQPGGALRVAGATLESLVAFVYGVRGFQISGGPSWIHSDRFDINARPERSPAAESLPADPSQITNSQHDAQRRTVTEQTQERLKSLLAERFQLAIHRESKEQDVYALVAARNGPKFQEGEAGSRSLIRGGRGVISGQGTGMQMLAINLSNQTGRLVIDKTGLKGKYDFKLEWTPDPTQGSAPLGAPPSGMEGPPADLNGPSIFAALQEQLGLRLESQKGPVEMLVIDRVEKPSEN